MFLPIDVINKFIDFYETNKKNIKTLDYLKNDKDYNSDYILPELNNEIELTLYDAPIECFSYIYRYIKNDDQKKTYFMLSFKLKSNGNKYRHYIPFTKFNAYNITNNQINNSFLNNKWNAKKIVNMETLENIGDFKHSIEYDELMFSNKLLENKIQIHFVREVNIPYKNINLNVRLSVNIQDGEQKKLILYDYLNNFKFNYNESCKVEFEITNLNVNKEELYKELSSLFSILYGFNDIKNLIILNNKFNTPFKTNVIPHKQLFKIPLNEIAITPKVDGKTCMFELKNNKLYLTINYRILIFDYKINLKKNIIGYGEYDNKVIYPFYIQKEGNRLKNLLSFLDSVKDVNETINIKEKTILTNFETYKDLLCSLYIMLDKKYSFEIDGIIFFNPNTINDKFIDYKFKLDNTVDVLTYINVSKGILMSGNKIELTTYILNNNNLEKMETIIKNIYNDCYFDMNLNMLVIKNNNAYTVLPHHFISEYSFKDKDILRYRIDKTNNIYNKYKYKGNSKDVIEKSKNMQLNNEIVSMLTLLDIYNNQDGFPDDDSIIDMIFTQDNTKYFYNNDIKIRTILNIYTNIIKTSLISNAINSRINNKYFNNVLDIDAGNGGDMNKLFLHNVKNVVATDIDSNALIRYSERHMKLNNERNKSKMFKLETITTSIVSADFISKISKYQNNFDMINYQLAIHFYWQKDYIPIIVKNLKYFCKSGTVLIITTNYGDKLKEKFKLADNLKYLVDKDKNIYFKYFKDENDTMKVIYEPSTGDTGSIENLVFKDTIINEFKKEKFSLVDMITFDTYYNNIDMFNYIIKNSKRDSAKKMYKGFIDMYNKNIENKNEITELLNLFIGYVFIYDY